jgi:hypothetical protein
MKIIYCKKMWFEKKKLEFMSYVQLDSKFRIILNNLGSFFLFVWMDFLVVYFLGFWLSRGIKQWNHGQIGQSVLDSKILYILLVVSYTKQSAFKVHSCVIKQKRKNRLLLIPLSSVFPGLLFLDSCVRKMLSWLNWPGTVKSYH